MHQYNFGVQFERIAIDIAGPFPRIDQGNRYFLIAMDYVTKPMPFPIKRLRQWRKHWLPTSSVAAEYRGSYITTRAITSSVV
jgi:hypothetical protein